MNVDHVLELGRSAVMMTVLVGAPVMVMAVLTGLIISVFQAVTQLQDQTLTFVPKIIVMLLTLLYALPWLLAQMVEYSTEIFEGIPGSL
ncbi:MAG: flagellar biosynthesis protein FliQ [Planctomycetaceae bacterium]|nr:flagellar biosynthesis protein FliQ [Planctomycetaceae bacterium]